MFTSFINQSKTLQNYFIDKNELHFSIWWIFLSNIERKRLLWNVFCINTTEKCMTISSNCLILSEFKHSKFWTSLALPRAGCDSGVRVTISSYYSWLWLRFGRSRSQSHSFRLRKSRNQSRSYRLRLQQKLESAPVFDSDSDFDSEVGVAGGSSLPLYT
jgi:hypothetical protein